MAGLWEVELFRVDGFDSTQYVRYNDVKGYRFAENGKFNSKGNGDYHYIKEVKTNGEESDFGHWGERDNRKMLMSMEYKHTDYRPFHINFDPDAYYDVVKYKKNQAWFRLQLDGHTYELHLKRID